MSTTIIDISALDGADGFRFDGANIGNAARAGQGVSATDINGDGFSDVVIGAPNATVSGYGFGETFVIFGKASGFASVATPDSLDGADGFRIRGPVELTGFGNDIAGPGDVNGDGFVDLAFRAGSNGASNSNAGFVLFGQTGAFSRILDLDSLDGADGVRFNLNINDNSRKGVDIAGDINGDGFSDIAFGAAYADPGGVTDAGEAYVVFGKASGFGALETVAGLDGADGFKIEGLATGDSLGAKVATAGDINGDGLDDLIIDASAADGLGQNNSGVVYVVFGSTAAFGASVDVSALDGADGFEINGLAANTFSGRSVAAIGDINGDGIGDMVIDTPGFDASLSNIGRAQVIFGNAGGFNKSFDITTLDASEGFTFDGSGQTDQFGVAIAGAGDVNGDGIDDLLVSAYTETGANGQFSGAAYVLFGDAGGFPLNFNTASLDATQGFKVEGRDAEDRLGSGLNAAGDINGDGFADIIIGADHAEDEAVAGTVLTGEVYVIFGFNSGAVTQQGGSSADTLTGSGAVDVLVGGLGDDVLIGGGGNDALTGGAGDDVLSIADNAFRRLDGGAGTDTVRVAGASQALDLTQNIGVIAKNYEAVDLAGAGSSVTVDSLAVLESSNTSNTLTITGSNAETLTISDVGWNLTAEDITTETYTLGQASLIVDKDVTIAFILFAGDDVATANADQTTTLTAASLIANDVSQNGAGAITIVNATAITGNVSIVGGDIIYDPNSQFDGLSAAQTATDTLTYTIGDGGAETDIGVITLTVQGVNDAPAIVGPLTADASRLDDDFSVDLLEGASDGDVGDVLAIANLVLTGGDDSGVTVNATSLDVDTSAYGGVGDGQQETISYSFDVVDDNGGSTPQTATITLTGANTLTGTGAGETLEGGAGADELLGLGGDDLLKGLGGDDVLRGGDDNDTLVLSGGEDRVFGDAGDDDIKIFANAVSAGDEVDGGAGANDRLTIVNPGVTDLNTLALLTGIEEVAIGVGSTVTGTNDDLSWLGSSGGETFNLGAGVDTVSAGAGDDTVNGGDGADILNGQDGIDTLNGDEGDDTLIGGLGNDILDGGTGADDMSGGLGDDTYTVDDVGDVVNETGAGTDTVNASVNFTIAAQIENLVLTGSAINGTGNAGANTITGNGLANNLGGGADNDILNGLGGSDRLDGHDGDDQLNGGEGADTIVGGDGDDFIDGGAGADFMIGGGGSDTYVVETFGDRVFERFFGTAGDIDTVQSFLTFSTGFTIEALELQGTANLNGFGSSLENTLSGNSGNNKLFGGGSDDILNGNDGIDQLFGNDDNDTLSGGADNDLLVGGAGDDVLDGGTGADRLYGGTGDDTFIVDNLGDVVVEFNFEPGTDIVQSFVSFKIAGTIERLELQGTDNIFGFGNNVANAIIGNDGNNSLAGAGGSDFLSGGDGDDQILGQSGGDNLFGGDGDDRLSGSFGNDSYTGGAGFDKIYDADFAGDADNFIVAPGMDTDVVQGFQNGRDEIDVSAFGFTQISDLNGMLQQINGHAVFDFAPDDRLILIGINTGVIDASDFIFAV